MTKDGGPAVFQLLIYLIPAANASITCFIPEYQLDENTAPERNPSGRGHASSELSTGYTAFGTKSEGYRPTHNFLNLKLANITTSKSPFVLH